MWVVLLQLKPGLSYYAKDPQAAANSLTSLLDKAESVVPLDLQLKTTVRVGVRELLKSRSTLKSEANGVKILDGSQEGSYEWRICFWASVAPAAILALFMEFSVESPHWLFKVHTLAFCSGVLDSLAVELKASKDFSKLYAGIAILWLHISLNQPSVVYCFFFFFLIFFL
ncbi:hypothetical protein PVK06_026700 [Gossypium arboreum]|uniref:apyrase n=1 Tax=Gossypium arboreum TaxID=29729 RepID=A0ABR0NYB4_GOSAR|nr:hypothetical protein PVK06_026700 [Gossypium arboreum]